MARPLTAALLLWAAHPASAHVSYIDITASPGGSAFANYGWWAGTLPTLGDSHDLAGGDFFKFHLDQAARVTITFRDTDTTINAGKLNPAFSLYRGLLPDEAHDSTAVDPLNPTKVVVVGGLPKTVKIASPVDNDIATDTFGRISPFRDTENMTFDGQFNASGAFSMANDSGEWTVIEYLAHVAPTGGTSVTLSNFLLGPGDYTIAAAGGTNLDLLGASFAATGISGEVSLTVSPVPEPAAFWMFAAGLALIATTLRTRPRSAWA